MDKFVAAVTFKWPKWDPVIAKLAKDLIIGSSGGKLENNLMALTNVVFSPDLQRSLLLVKLNR